MDSAIKFCALGALYNGDKEEYLDKCLTSIANQTLKLPIYIVIDGPINNDLESKLAEYAFLNITFLKLEENYGLAIALAHGVNFLKANYDYAIRFDSDDINMPNRFENLCNYIEQFQPDLVSSHMYEVDENDMIFSERKVPIEDFKIKQTIAYRNPINHPASAFKISSVIASGGYKEMPFFEDWYLWSRMFNKGYKIENIDDFLVSFRATDAMVSRRYGLDYVKHEARFFSSRSSENLINPIKNWSAFLLRLAVKVFGFGVYKKIFFWIRR